GLRSEARRCAAGEYAASAARGSETADPGIGADIIHHNIDAALAGEFPNLLVEFFSLVINQEISAKLARALELFIGACRSKYAAAGHLRDLNCGRSDARAGTEDQHIFTRTDVSFRHHHAPGGQEHEWSGRSVLEGDRIGNRQNDVGRNGNQFRISAVSIFTDHGIGCTLTSESGSAKLAPATTDAVLYRPALHHRWPRHAGSNLSNNSSGITTENFRQGDFNSRHPTAEEDIDVIDRRGFNVNENFPGPRLWFVYVPVLEDLGTAMFLKN